MFYVNVHENKLLWPGTNKFWSRFVKFELVLVETQLENQDLPWYRRSPQIEQIEPKLEQIGANWVRYSCCCKHLQIVPKVGQRSFPARWKCSQICVWEGWCFSFLAGPIFLSVLEDPVYSNFRKWNWHFWKYLLNFWKVRLRFVNWRFRDFFENWIHRQCTTNNSLLSQILTTFSISTVLEVAKPVL